MDKNRKIIRSPTLKRRSRPVPINQRVTLERVIGLTASTNATLTCDLNTGTIAYPAGCVVVLFNPRRNKQSHIFNTSKKTITSLAFSPDGKQLVTGESGHQPAVRVWDVQEKTQVAEFHGHKFGIVCVKFSPSLKYLVSIGSQHDMMVNVWNWKTGTKIASNKISSKVNSVAFSSDGSMFVTVGNRHVKFWYLEGSKSKINETVPLQGRNGILGDHKNNYFCDVACGRAVYAITQTGLLCQFNEKRLLDMWVELRTTNANCISAGEDYIFIGCANGVVRIFDSVKLNYVASMPKPHPLGIDVASALSPSQMICQSPDAKFPDVVALCFDDCHKKVTCVYNDHSLYIWDVHDVKKIGKSWSFLYHSGCIWGLEVNPSITDQISPILPSGSFITCSSDDTIRIWNLDPHMTPTESCKRNVYSNELLKVIYVDPSLSSLQDINYNPAGGTDKTDTNYDGKNGVRSVGISPDGRHLASGDRIGNVRVHDLMNMKEILNIEAHDQEVLCVQYSYLKTGPQLLASSSRDRLVHVFDVEQRYGLLQTLDDHSSSVTAIKFTENDNQIKMLSSSADKSVLFRNAQSSPSFQFVLANQHVVGNNSLYDMDIEPTHKFVATACQDRNIRIYNIKSAKQKKCYKGAISDTGVLLKLQLDPSGLYAATSCTDKNLCIIDFHTGELLATMFGHSELATGVKFMNDLKHLVTVSSDGCIFVWKLPQELTAQMKSRLEDMGQLPMEAINGGTPRKPDNYDEELGRAPLFPNEQGFKTPTKILAELQQKEREAKSQSSEESSDFRYSVGPLPNWLKAKMGEGKTEKKVDKRAPAGKWAKRIDNPEDLSQLDIVDGDLQRDQKVKKVQKTADFRRETMILSKAENTPRKVPRISDHTEEDEEDEDFFPAFQKDNGEDSGSSNIGSEEFENRWSKHKSLSFSRSQEDLDEIEDDSPEVIYYPPSEASGDTCGSSFTVFTGHGEKKSSRNSSGRASLSERTPDAESSSTDPVSLEELEDEDDSGDVSSTPATPGDELPLKTPDREKFLKETFENLNFVPENKEKFKESLDEQEKRSEMDDQNGFNPRLSISSRFLSRAQQANIRNIAVYNSVQRQDNWFDSLQKRKDVMARAVDETRKTLMAMGWKDESPDAESESRPQVQEVGDGRKSVEREDLPPPSPRTPASTPLRRCWSTFDLPKHPIQEERIPVSIPYHNSSTPTGNKYTAGSSVYATPESSAPRWRSRIPTPLSLSQKTSCSQVRQIERPSESDSEGSVSSARVTTRRSRPSTLSIKREEKKKPEPRSQSQSSIYRKHTDSAKTKTDKKSSCAPGVLSKSNSLQNLHNDNVKKQLPKAKSKGLSKGNAYVSTPNLAGALSDTSDEVDFLKDPSGKLSSSTPDLLDEGPQKPKKGEKKLLPDTKRFSTGTPKKPYTSTESGRKSARLSLPNSRRILNDKSDKDLMPPPTNTNVSKSKQNIFIKRATQSQPKSKTSELTLDQAKNILMGKSGILSNEPASDVSSDDSQVSSHKSIPKVTSPPVHLNSNLLEIATEIDMTADEIHRKNVIDSAFQNLASLDASPNDLPERDYTPVSLNSTLTSVTSISSSQNSLPDYLAGSDIPSVNDSWTSSLVNQSSDNEFEDSPSRSIKDRIAQLHAHSSPAISNSHLLTSHISVSCSPSSVAMVSPGSNSSPHSSGVGSSLDSETAAKMFNGVSPLRNSHDVSDNHSYSLEHALDVVSHSAKTSSTSSTETTPTSRQVPAQSYTPQASSRSTPSSSSQSTIGASPTQSPRKSDDLQLCMKAIKDLRKAVSQATETYRQVKHNNDPTSVEALKMLSDNIEECSAEMWGLLGESSMSEDTEMKDLLIRNIQMLKRLTVPK